MKTLFKIITMLCAIVGVYFMAMAFIDRTTRESEDRLHIAQLKGKIPFGRLVDRVKTLRGNTDEPDDEDEGMSVHDYRDGGEEEPEDEPAPAPSSAITARLPRVAGKREAAERRQRLSKYSTDARPADGGFSEDDLEGLLDD